jgi:hypothetical protein
VDALDFGRRMAVEKDLLAATTAAIKAFLAPPPEAGKAPTGRAENVYRPPASNAVFDESGNFIIYPSPLGVKIVNLITNRVCVLLKQVVVAMHCSSEHPGCRFARCWVRWRIRSASFRWHYTKVSPSLLGP